MSDSGLNISAKSQWKHRRLLMQAVAAILVGESALTAARAWANTSAGATVLLPGRSQDTHKLFRIGLFSVTAGTSEMTGPEPRLPSTRAFLRGMGELGYRYGDDFVTEPRGGEGLVDRYPALARELLHLSLDVIVAAGPTLHALDHVGVTTPIVMGGGEDPVGQGFAQSLAKPGGWFTGLSNQAVEVTSKRIELLKTVVPNARSIAVLWDPEAQESWKVASSSAQSRGWKLLSFPVRTLAEVERALSAAIEAKADALLLLGALLLVESNRINDLAMRARLPVLFSQRAPVELGGLMSYGADINDIWRRAAGFVDKILRGARPGDLPVEQPTKFELVVNLRTAKALGLTIPTSVLLSANALLE